MGIIRGYARCSTNGQDLSLQVAALKAAGATKVYSEKVSGADRDNRPQLARLLKSLEPGDVVVVARLDRLARSTRDLLNCIHEVTEAGAQFKSLADAWCDTTTPHGKLLLTILAGLAEFERSLIKARTESGIKRAREIGVQFGRPARLNTKQKRMIAERHAKGASMQDLADEFECGVATVFRSIHGRR